MSLMDASAPTEATTDPKVCQHYRIDNEMWQCQACGHRMESQQSEMETVLSAPNANPCRNPAHLEAMEAGEDFECDHPYVPDLSRQREVPIRYNITYRCDRCHTGGSTTFTPYETVYGCGLSHRGHSVPIPVAARRGDHE